MIRRRFDIDRCATHFAALAVFAVLAWLVPACSYENGIVGGDCLPGDCSGDVRKPQPSASADAGTAADAAAPTDDAAPRADVDAGLPASCPAGKLYCAGRCIDPSSDEMNCGACGNVCPSLICVQGSCVGSLAGDITLIGHDYASPVPADGPQAKVLTNAVFSRGVAVLHVLAFVAYADWAAVTNVKDLLVRTASGAGRWIAFSEEWDPSGVGNVDLNRYDVVLVFDQPGAPENALGAIGAGWNAGLSKFASAGGAVVVLDGATAAEMPSLVSGAGLFNLKGQAPVARTAEVTNIDPGDSVGVGVLSPYRATAHSASFQIDAQSPNLSYVIWDDDAQAPVVVHRWL